MPMTMFQLIYNLNIVSFISPQKACAIYIITSYSVFKWIQYYFVDKNKKKHEFSYIIFEIS